MDITEEDIFGEEDVLEDAPEEVFYDEWENKTDYDGCIPIYRKNNEAESQ